MKKLLLLIIIFSNSCYGQDFFEGIITFKTDIRTSDYAPLHLQKTLEHSYGDSLKVFYFQNGNMIRKYLNTIKYGNNYQVYNNDSGKLIITTKGANKIDTLDVTKNSLQLVSKLTESEKQKIAKLNCDCITYDVIDTRNEKVIIEFCYSSKLKLINPNKFRNHKDFFLDDFFSLSKTPYLKFRMKRKDFELTFTAIHVEEKFLVEDDIIGK